MGSLSLWHWIIILAIVLLVFGGKFKVSDVMGDVAKGIKSFKKGMAEEVDEAKSIEETVEEPVAKAETLKKAVPVKKAKSKAKA